MSEDKVVNGATEQVIISILMPWVKSLSCMAYHPPRGHA